MMQIKPSGLFPLSLCVCIILINNHFANFEIDTCSLFIVSRQYYSVEIVVS